MMMSVDSELSVRRRSELLGINRSSLYYAAHPVEMNDVDLLNTIRDIWSRYPFYGYRKITQWLCQNGMNINHKRVQRLMAEGGIQAIFPGPNTSLRNHKEAVYPYLLRDIAVVRPNQVWMTDITYLKMSEGFMYLTALIDVYSRYVVGWSLSNTLETIACLDALTLALELGIPEIVNSDQGCQFTSHEWIEFLVANNIQISMTGKGRCLDNIYIERFWRSFKYEEFYLNAYEDIQVLRNAISAYIEFYNNERFHQSLNYKTPVQLYRGRH